MAGEPLGIQSLQAVLNTMASLGRSEGFGDVSNSILLQQVIDCEGLIRQLQAAQVTAMAQMVVRTAPATRKVPGPEGRDPSAGAEDGVEDGVSAGVGANADSAVGSGRGNEDAGSAVGSGRGDEDAGSADSSGRGDKDADFAAGSGHCDQDTESTIGPRALVTAEIGPALTMSRVWASIVVTAAVNLRENLPDILSLVSAGRLDWHRAKLIADRMHHPLFAPSWFRPGCPEWQLFQAILKREAPSKTAPQLKRFIEQLFLALDPDGANRRHERAKQGRQVRFSALPHGMAEMRGVFTADVAQLIEGVLHAMADSCRDEAAANGTPDPRTHDQLCADAMAATFEALGGGIDVPVVPDPRQYDRVQDNGRDTESAGRKQNPQSRRQWPRDSEGLSGVADSQAASSSTAARATRGGAAAAGAAVVGERADTAVVGERADAPAFDECTDTKVVDGRPNTPAFGESANAPTVSEHANMAEGGDTGRGWSVVGGGGAGRVSSAVEGADAGVVTEPLSAFGEEAEPESAKTPRSGKQSAGEGPAPIDAAEVANRFIQSSGAREQLDEAMDAQDDARRRRMDDFGLAAMKPGQVIGWWRPSRPLKKGRGAQVIVTMTDATLQGKSEEPGLLMGYGPIAANQARRVASDADRIIVIDPSDSGKANLADDSGCAASDHTSPATRRYRPNRRLIDLVLALYQCCTYPGCTTPASKCDLDHVVPFQRGGPTCQCNMRPACRMHHRIKSFGGWRVRFSRPDEDLPVGTVIWRSPAGMQYATAPTSLPGSSAWRWPGDVRPTEEPVNGPDDPTEHDTASPAERTAARLERWRRDIQQVNAQTERRERATPPVSQQRQRSQQRENRQEDRGDPPF